MKETIVCATLIFSCATFRENSGSNRSETIMALEAFISRRVITPEGVRHAAVLVNSETIRGVVMAAQVPAGAVRHDFGDAAILPGLVDSHVHINEPGRAEWEGFSTATRAAAAGGYTMLVDMPLNSLPATTTVAALEQKRAAAHGKCRVDWAAWEESSVTIRTTSSRWHVPEWPASNAS